MLAMLAMLAGLAACHSHDPVRIGVVVSGAAVAGAQLAQAEINASGGIRSRALELRIMSTGGSITARPALASAESLASDPRVIGVVGHSNSSASLSASQIYNDHEVVQIAPTSSAPLLSHVGRFTFRLVPSDVNQARFLADEIVSRGALPRVALFFVNDDYGHALHQELREQLRRRAVQIVYDMPFAEELPLPNARGAARAIVESAPDLLIWLGRAPQLLQLIPELRKHLPAIPILASDGIDSEKTERNGDGVLTGVRYVCFFNISSDRKELADLRKHFEARSTAKLSVEAALGYDATMILATAAREVGPHRAAIRDYLATLGHSRPPYAGASGLIEFDASGDAPANYCINEITATGLRAIAPAHAR